MRILEIKYKKRKINQHVDTSSDKNRDETYLPNMQAISNLNNIFNRLLRRFTPCNDIIKYIALILFMFIFYNFKAQVITITISMENVSLGEILQEIKKQSGKNILYNNNKVDIYKKESINIENLTLTEALDECLRNKDLQYKIVDDVIIIEPKKEKTSVINPEKLTQTIKGKVVDKESQISLPGANIVILGANPLIGGITDLNGNYKIESVPVGRYNIQMSYIGYNPLIIPEVIVGSGKEVVINAELKELITELEEIAINAYIRKDKPLNSMATVSARTITVEEMRRLPGSFDDPSKLASCFAGVAQGYQDNNGISVRGNAPKGISWRLEGIDIPNPNHFGNIGTFGGGGLTAFSSLLLSNSDFFISAFPAEYGNALSGVFDFKFRNGNYEKREHAFQIGLMGIDFSSEGPFKKEKEHSYIFNYRYSTFGLLKHLIPILAVDLRYQDFCFKLNFPTKKAGNFSVWGIGAIDYSELNENSGEQTWETLESRQPEKITQNMGVIGFNHKKIINNKTYFNSTLSLSGNGTKFKEILLDSNLVKHQAGLISNVTWRYTFSSFVNHKFSKKHTNRTGIIFNNLNYNIDIKHLPDFGFPLIQIVDENANSNLLQVFSQSKYYFNDKLILNAGIHFQYFLLNKKYTVEPRIGIQWNVKSNQSISVAYGNHSQLETLGLYLANVYKNETVSQSNRNLEFTRAHHIVFGYDISINENTRFKIEPYVQFLYNVPVIPDSSFSTINMEANWYINDELVSEGTGINVGIDATLERFLNKGYYYIITSSLFDSKYRGGDGVLRNTRYNSNYIINILFGKEWIVGKDGKNNILGINGRFNLVGGQRTHPIDSINSVLNKQVIYDYNFTFEEQKPLKHYLILGITFRKNKKNYASTWSLQVYNLTASKEYHAPVYNYKTNSIQEVAYNVVAPTFSYKIDF